MVTAYLGALRLFSHNVRLYLISSALAGFAFFGINAVLFNLYLLRLGYGPEFIGTVNSSGLLAFGLFSLPAGGLGDRWGIRRSMIVGVATMAIGLGLLPLGEFMTKGYHPGWLIVTYMLTGFGASLYFVNANPFLMSSSSEEERSHVFSVREAFFPLAGFVGNLVGGLLPGIFVRLTGLSLDHPAPYRYSLLIAAILLLPGVGALLATREIKVEHTKETVTERERAPLLPIALLGLTILLGTSGDSVVMTFFNVYLDSGLDLPTTQIGMLLAIGQLFVVPAALSMPLIAARWGRDRAILLGFFGVILSLMPLALIPHWGAAGLGFIGVRALGTIRNPALSVYGMEMVKPRWRTAMSGAMTMAFGLGISAMALGGGYIIAALGYRYLFLTGAGLTTIGGLIYWSYFFRVPRGELAQKLVVDIGE